MSSRGYELSLSTSPAKVGHNGSNVFLCVDEIEQFFILFSFLFILIFLLLFHFH